MLFRSRDLPGVPTGVSVVGAPPPDDIPQNPDPARVRNAARLAGLLDDVEDFPQGFDTMLGERGVTLSGGQRQRTAIARAIVREPAILILDDSLSAVDTETERRIVDGLREVSQGRTVILIAHRVSGPATSCPWWRRCYNVTREKAGNSPSAPKRRPNCCPMDGQAMCANWKTSCNAQWCCAPVIASNPNT